MGHGVQAIGLARVTGDEDQLAVGRPARRPLQVVLDLGRLAVLINAEEADVEVIAGIFEIVRIAAEEGDVLFGREDQADVGVFLVAIEMVLTAVVKRDDIAPQARLLRRFLLDGVHDRAAGLFRLGQRATLGNGRVDPLGDVFDAHQHVQFKVDALHLLVLRLGVESFGQIVLVLAAELLQGVGADVVIRQHQPVGRHERPGAAGIEAHARSLQVLEPGLIGLEAVLFLEDLPGRIVEEPHAFVSQSGRTAGKSDPHAGQEPSQPDLSRPFTDPLHIENSYCHRIRAVLM